MFQPISSPRIELSMEGVHASAQVKVVEIWLWIQVVELFSPNKLEFSRPFMQQKLELALYLGPINQYK